MIDEDLAVDLLKKIARHWPETLWIFAADERLYVMRKKNGKRAMTDRGGVDQDYIIAQVDIEADGGDWD